MMSSFVLNIDITLGLSKHDKIPKLLFPFNEDYLKFAVAESLERQGIKCILELAISVTRDYPVRIYGISLPELGYRQRTIFVYPDLFLPDYGFFIEVENFYSFDRGHVYNYINTFKEMGYPFNGCALTWKCKKLKEELSGLLYFIDPITGKGRILVTKGEPITVQMNQDTYPAGKPHVWIQYELYRWLRTSGYLCSAEIDVGMSGHVFVPDEIWISLDEGIIMWKPERFTKFSGWSWNHTSSSVPKEVPVRVDICSYNGSEINCYEVKLRDDFTTEHKAMRVLHQLRMYMTIGVFDKMWLVGPYELLKKIWEEAPEAFSGELKKIGILGYKYPERKFEIIKDARELKVKKRDYIKISIT